MRLFLRGEVFWVTHGTGAEHACRGHDYGIVEAEESPEGSEGAQVARQGGEIDGNTRKVIEAQTGKSICTSARGLFALEASAKGMNAEDEKPGK